jgi:hypothetical protein
MNTLPPRQHEVLSDEERELARVVRALPGGGPSAALDSLILKAASDAVAASDSQKKSFWAKKGLLGTSALWLGTAAASVLTIGIGWQVFQSMSAPIYELPAGENVSSAQVLDSSKSESTAVEMIPARDPIPTSPPPPEAIAQSDQAADAAAFVAPPEPAPALTPPARARQEAGAAFNELADTEDKAMAKPSADSERRNQAVEQDWVPQASGALARANAAPAAKAAAPASPSIPAVAAAPVASESYRNSESEKLESVIVSGSRIKGDAADLDKVQVFDQKEIEESKKKQVAQESIILKSMAKQDAKLAPDLWLAAIQKHVKENDIELAKASLKLFRKTHRTIQIPKELKPLLK